MLATAHPHAIGIAGGSLLMVYVATTGEAARAADTAPALDSLLGLRMIASPRIDPLPSPPNEICELGRTDRQHGSSRTCVSCHDGSVAIGIGHQGASGTFSGGGETHPVDVNFVESRMLSRGSLNEVADVPEALVLQGGRTMTCLTCHDGASSLPSHTAVTMEQSALCLACHNM